MYFAVCFALAGLLAQQPSQVKKPRPIPIEEREGISVLMLQIQAAQLQALEVRGRLSELQRRFDALMAGARQKYGAEGCELTLEKAWACPAAEAKGVQNRP